ncbi:TetR/AcrR family transcriptional regulator [Sphingomonas sp. CV7422]|uniref:TetR/AcrR family transcriptional regulator n=1 Tax=Sphingomonas sp. CV7422 TaxID=3018036 RepID=UPI0022FF2A5D|nr:TetR family transcriptional regulator [Sphingomonas sp. CV7422]
MPSATPRRLSPAASRDAALAAAQALLIESGPPAVTLKAVAARIGRTHANLLHHFGSAEGLQLALIGRMTTDITATIRDAVLRDSSTPPDSRRLVDLVFDAFDGGGAGALASWMILSGNRDALDPILAAVHDLVDDLAAGVEPAGRPIGAETLQLVLLALGDALLGAAMARALGLPRDTARACAASLLAQATPD